MEKRRCAPLAARMGLVCSLLAACTATGLTPAELEMELEREAELDEVETIYAYEEELEPSDVGTSEPRCVEGGQEGLGRVDNPQDQPSSGQLLTQLPNGDYVGLPLQHTAFDSVVVGTVAETLVTQTFHNPLENPAEVVYVFPLPNEAAVDDYWIEVGERSVRGVIEEREKARRIYEEAKKDGHTAGLLLQERPNVFTQNVANIPPGESVEVTIHIVQSLRQDDGRFELVLPTVVGPRYRFGHNPPSLGNTPRRCGRLDISVAVEAGVELDDLRSRAHAVKAQHDGDVTFVELAREESRLDRDFSLSWTTARARTQAALQLQPEPEGGGYFTVSVHPPVLESAVVPPRELIFVVDTSGSMSGAPMDAAKGAMRKFMAGMKPEDAFSIVRFSDTASSLGDQLLAATPENIEQGLAYIEDMQGGGGTEMTAGIRAALGVPGRDDRIRMVMFLTDGYIGNESEILALVEDAVADARLFSLGVGSSPNRSLLDGLARVGRGSVTYVDNHESPDQVVDRFYEQIGRPAVTDLSVDYGHMPTFDVVPGKIPDLFVGRPVVLYGRYAGAVPTSVTLRGKVAGEDYEMRVPVKVAARHGRGDGLRSLWARHQIDDLVLSLLNEASQRRRARVDEEILELSLEHRVLTDLTAFVAVDTGAKVDGVQQGHTIVQAVDGVQGMAWERTTGHTPVPGEDLDEGLIGSGGGGGSGSGYGSGSGAGFGGRGKRVPHVRQAYAQVRGALGVAIIKRIVRAHINEVRGCYNQALVADPEVAGRMVVSFVIAESGKVVSVVISESDLDDPSLHRCVARHVKRWKFPVGEGAGNTVVNYPFVLSVPE